MSMSIHGLGLTVKLFVVDEFVKTWPWFGVCQDMAFV